MIKMMSWIQNKLERLGIAYRSKYYAPDSFYEYAIDVSVEKSQTLPIRIMKGKYAGVVYCYDTIKIGKENVDGTADATYNIDVIQFTEKLRKDFYNDKKFLKVVGNVLLSIFWETIQQDESKKGNVDDEHREDYIEEPVPNRTVRSKDSPIH
jgi:hypothetical protein